MADAPAWKAVIRDGKVMEWRVFAGQQAGLRDLSEAAAVAPRTGRWGSWSLSRSICESAEHRRVLLNPLIELDRPSPKKAFYHVCNGRKTAFPNRAVD
jgi:hypothetical protein